MPLETNYLFKKHFACQENMKILNPQEIKSVQKVLLEMVKDVKAVCEENSIFYMLGGGTALGAIRHQGFIPWDDDLDVNMFHSDIECFANELEKKFPGKYFMQIPGKTEGYFSTFAQIHKKGTVFQEDKEQKEEEAGIKIDIFPIENTFDSAVARKIHGLGCDAAHLLLSGYRLWVRRKELKELSRSIPEARVPFMIKRIISLPVLIAPNFWNHMFHKWFGMCRNRKSRYVVIPSGRRHFFGELYERRSYCDIGESIFEDTRLPITQNIQEYMEQLYGKDYMKVPPEEERERHMLYKFKV